MPPNPYQSPEPPEGLSEITAQIIATAAELRKTSAACCARSAVLVAQSREMRERLKERSPELFSVPARII